MSNVTNVMVLVERFDDRRLMAPFTVEDESRRWRGLLSDITNEDADRYWVHNGKGPACNVWVGAFNHFNRTAFLEDLQQVPWEFPRGVQALIKGQDDACWGLWMFRQGKLREVHLPYVIRTSSESQTLENGQWIRIPTGILMDNESSPSFVQAAPEKPQDYCCEVMWKEFEVEDDEERYISYSSQFNEYGLIDRLDPKAYTAIAFCPWCGKNILSERYAKALKS